jgi:hypothetical protein
VRAGICKRPSDQGACRRREHCQSPPWYAFAQILGKFHFFKLRENLLRILLDYGQKRPCTANAAFKAAC